jgi:hypothetical protein
MSKNQPTQESPFVSLTRLNWRAILTGAVADILLTELMGVSLGAIFTQVSGLSATEADALNKAFRASPLFWVAVALGILISGLGGFIAGWLANAEHHLHGLVSAFLTNVVFTVLVSGDSPFTIIEFSSAMLGLLAGLGGGWLAGILRAKRAG